MEVLLMNTNEILLKLKELKPEYEKEGLILLGLFGSYAKNTQTKFSDIDVAYKLDYDKFSLNYKGGFSKLLRIDDIKKELQSIFKIPVDLVPDSNKAILKELINV
jgi:predicted nucleotidyltransferase